MSLLTLDALARPADPSPATGGPFAGFATREALAAELDRLGIGGRAAEEILTATGPARHGARAARARRAALDAVMPLYRDHTDAGHVAPAAAAVLLWTEAHAAAVRRAGGRPGWMAGLGTGRRDAGDGPAWSRAVADAARAACPGGLRPVRSASGPALLAEGPGCLGGLWPADLAGLNVAGYALALAREGLRRAMCLRFDGRRSPARRPGLRRRLGGVGQRPGRAGRPAPPRLTAAPAPVLRDARRGRPAASRSRGGIPVGDRRVLPCDLFDEANPLKSPGRLSPRLHDVRNVC